MTAPISVAVVEDDPRIQLLISEEITDEGHDCKIFGTAEEFLDALEEQQFQLLLLDLMLPGIDGITCLKRLKECKSKHSGLRVVVVTALNDPEKRCEALANGAENYIIKPELFEQLPLLLSSLD